MNNSFKLIISLITFVAAYVFFVIVEFPLDAVIGHYLAKVESQTKGEYRISVSPDMQTSLLFDSKFKNFEVDQKTESGFKRIFFAPKIKVGFSFFSLISGATNVSFVADMPKGRLEGSVGLAPNRSVYDLTFKKVALADVPILASYLPVPISGKIDGTLYLALQSNIKDSEGEFKLKIFDLTTDKYNIKQANLDVPPLVLSSSEKTALIQGALEAGFFKLDEFSLPGPDIELQLKGRIQFLKGNSTRSNLNGKFKVSDKVEQALPFFSFLAEQKTAEGDYPISLAGDLKKPRVSVGSLKLSEMLNISSPR